MALLVILLANAVMNFWNLGINGWANAYYSAAVQAGYMNPSAFLFGSLDWGNSITVDKPPLSLWLMGISARVFGLSPQSIIVPQAVMGVLTTYLIYKILRRNFSAISALAASLVFFTTPIITLLSRYNNPDPLMLLLMVVAAYFVVIGVDTGKTKHIALAGVMLGLAFLTKQLQALLCVPAIALAYFIASRSPWWARVRRGLVGLVGMVVTGASWVVLVELVPPNERPFVGGSPNNSFLQLTFGYNGVDRITSTREDPTMQLLPSNFRSEESDAGFERLFNANFAQESSWLLIVALISVAILAFKWKSLAETPGRLATSILSVAWLLTTYVLLSFMGNGIHTYYAATLAPPLALVIGLAIDTIIRFRHAPGARLVVSITCVVGACFSAAILSYGVGWPGFLPVIILSTACAGAALIAIKPPTIIFDKVAVALIATGLLTGPVATSLYNITTSHEGSNMLSGPISKGENTISRFLAGAQTGNPLWAQELGYGLEPSNALIEHLTRSDSCRWAAATYPGQTAAKYQLAINAPVMALSGFMGVDPSPTTEQFQQEVTAGNICYLVWQQSHLDVPERSSTLLDISDWVTENFAAEEVDGTLIYDLRSPKR